ncbi:MAG: hypothetical protein V1707_03280 [bacterium]
MESISWTFKEFNSQHRSKRWYVIALVVVIALLIYAVVTINYLFALIVLLATAIVWYNQRREPNDVAVELSNQGITIQGKIYQYQTIKKFWIIYQPRHKDLYLESNQLVLPVTRIPLAGTDPLKVRELLLQFLTEDLEQEEAPLSEQLRDRLKL